MMRRDNPLWADLPSLQLTRTDLFVTAMRVTRSRCIASWQAVVDIVSICRLLRQQYAAEALFFSGRSAVCLSVRPSVARLPFNVYFAWRDEKISIALSHRLNCILVITNASNYSSATEVVTVSLVYCLLLVCQVLLLRCITIGTYSITDGLSVRTPLLQVFHDFLP